ncbi:bcl-2-like protein 15 [Spinachia spinachia]
MRRKRSTSRLCRWNRGCFPQPRHGRHLHHFRVTPPGWLRARTGGAMAPTAAFEWQTDQIVKCLLGDEDEDEACAQRCPSSQLEVDGPTSTSDEDDFDPVIIADKLRTVADSLNADAKFKAALADLKQAVAQEALQTAFSNGVEAICQTPGSQNAEVFPEMQLIRASVALCIYIKKSSPELKHNIQRVVREFLRRRVGLWVMEQGGWDKVV